MSKSNSKALQAPCDPTAADPRFRARFRIYYEDTDGTGVVYHANYLRFFERARTDWLRAVGFDQGRLAAEQSIVFTVAQVSLKFLAPAILDDLIDVDVRIAARRRASMVFDQRIMLVERPGAARQMNQLMSKTPAAGQVLSTASVEVVCIAQSTMKPCRMPAPLLEVLARDH